MSIRKRSTISDLGTYSSSNDQEIESRLKALEEKSHIPCGGDTSDLTSKVEVLEKKLDTLIGILKKDPKLNIQKLSNNTL